MFEKITQRALINQLAWETIVLPKYQQLYAARKKVRQIRLETLLTLVFGRELWISAGYVSGNGEKLNLKILLRVLKDKREALTLPRPMWGLSGL